MSPNPRAKTDDMHEWTASPQNFNYLFRNGRCDPLFRIGRCGRFSSVMYYRYDTSSWAPAVSRAARMPRRGRLLPRSFLCAPRNLIGGCGHPFSYATKEGGARGGRRVFALRYRIGRRARASFFSNYTNTSRRDGTMAAACSCFFL